MLHTERYLDSLRLRQLSILVVYCVKTTFTRKQHRQTLPNTRCRSISSSAVKRPKHDFVHEVQCKRPEALSLYIQASFNLFLSPLRLPLLLPLIARRHGDYRRNIIPSIHITGLLMSKQSSCIARTPSKVCSKENNTDNSKPKKSLII